MEPTYGIFKVVSGVAHYHISQSDWNGLKENGKKRLVRGKTINLK